MYGSNQRADDWYQGDYGNKHLGPLDPTPQPMQMAPKLESHFIVSRWKGACNHQTTGAQGGNRTRDLRITSALLYRLSYLGAENILGVAAQSAPTDLLMREGPATSETTLPKAAFHSHSDR